MQASWGKLPAPDHEPDREAARLDCAGARALREHASDPARVRSPDPPDRAVLAPDPRLRPDKLEADHPRYMAAHRRRWWWWWWRWRRWWWWWRRQALPVRLRVRANRRELYLATAGRIHRVDLAGLPSRARLESDPVARRRPRAEKLGPAWRIRQPQLVASIRADDVHVVVGPIAAGILIADEHHLSSVRRPVRIHLARCGVRDPPHVVSGEIHRVELAVPVAP